MADLDFLDTYLTVNRSSPSGNSISFTAVPVLPSPRTFAWLMRERAVFIELKMVNFELRKMEGYVSILVEI